MKCPNCTNETSNYWEKPLKCDNCLKCYKCNSHVDLKVGGKHNQNEDKYVCNNCIHCTYCGSKKLNRPFSYKSSSTQQFDKDVCWECQLDGIHL